MTVADRFPVGLQSIGKRENIGKPSKNRQAEEIERGDADRAAAVCRCLDNGGGAAP